MPIVPGTCTEGPCAQQKRYVIADARRLAVEHVGARTAAVDVGLHEVPADASGHASEALSDTLSR